MSSNSVLGNKDAAEVEANEHATIDEQPLEPTVELESQAKVDTNHPDARPEGMTLADEERFRVREREIARTRMRIDDRPDSDREARSRAVASEGSAERRRDFQRRAAAVDKWRDPNTPDPRVIVSQDELATINQEADRMADEIQGWSRAALARQLGKRVADGDSMMGAVVGVVEQAKQARGTIVPIGVLEDVPRKEVSIAGTVSELWTTDHPRIRQVGLIEDETGRTKFTSWTRSRQPIVEEGERVKMWVVAKNWYQGRVSVALTGRSRVTFPDRE